MDASLSEESSTKEPAEPASDASKRSIRTESRANPPRSTLLETDLNAKESFRVRSCFDRGGHYVYSSGMLAEEIGRRQKEIAYCQRLHWKAMRHGGEGGRRERGGCR